MSRAKTRFVTINPVSVHATGLMLIYNLNRESLSRQIIDGSVTENSEVTVDYVGEDFVMKDMAR